MKELIEDYQHRLQTITEVIKTTTNNGSQNDIAKMARLNAKASEYRTFIGELERVLRKPVVEKSFTLEEIKNYIRSQDSLGDVLYFLTEENIEKANQKPELDDSPENCKHYDECQGRHKCCSPDVEDHQCWGICDYYEEEL